MVKKLQAPAPMAVLKHLNWTAGVAWRFDAGSSGLLMLEGLLICLVGMVY